MNIHKISPLFRGSLTTKKVTLRSYMIYKLINSLSLIFRKLLYTGAYPLTRSLALWSTDASYGDHTSPNPITLRKPEAEHRKSKGNTELYFSREDPTYVSKWVNKLPLIHNTRHLHLDITSSSPLPSLTLGWGQKANPENRESTAKASRSLESQRSKLS